MKHVVYVGLTPAPDMTVGVAVDARHRLEEQIDALIEGAHSTGGGAMLDGSVVDTDWEVDEAIVVPGLLTLLSGMLPEGWTMTRVSVQPNDDE